MRSVSTPALSFAALLCVLAALAAAVDPVQLPGNRPIMADASPLASNSRIASQVPAQERLVPSRNDDVSRSPRLLVSELESASLNVKAVAHFGINRLIDLASSNTLVGYLMGNESSSIFAKAVPPIEDDSVASPSPRRQLTGMSVALVLVMIFFAVWM